MKDAAMHERIAGVLQAIGQLSGQGAVYHGLHDQAILTNGKVCAFCRHALAHPLAAKLCRYSCCNASVHAMTSGEPYFYQCWAGLLFVTVPVAPHNRCAGGISLGGFHPPDQRPDIRETIARSLGDHASADADSFLTRLPSLHPIDPSALRGLGNLAMETTFSSGLNSSDFFRCQNEKYLQQRRIAEAIADLRSEDVSPPDILRDTYQLVSHLRRQDRAAAMAFTSRYLAKLLMASNWDLIKLKAHVRTLLAVITSHEILNGMPWAVATSRELRHMARLEKAASTEESCYEVAEWIQRYFRRTEQAVPDGRSLGDRLLAWLQAHYQEPVTVTTAAKAVGVSASTLAHRLPHETGKTFRQLLVEIRIAEAKKLMATTALEISAVAEHCGFFDQSHFTRELKKTINLTPGQFRKLMRVPDNALRHPGVFSLDTPERRNGTSIPPPSSGKRKGRARRHQGSAPAARASRSVTSPTPWQDPRPTPHPAHSRSRQSRRRTPASPARRRS